MHPLFFEKSTFSTNKRRLNDGFSKKKVDAAAAKTARRRLGGRLEGRGGENPRGASWLRVRSKKARTFGDDKAGFVYFFFKPYSRAL